MDAVLRGSRVFRFQTIQVVKISFELIDQGKLSNFKWDVIPNASEDLLELELRKSCVLLNR